MMLLLAACKPTADSAFAGMDDVRMEINGKTVFTIKENNCQMSFNRSRCEFCAFTDNASDYFTAKLSAIPTSVGEVVSGDITWTTTSSVETRKNVALQLIKVEGDKLWLIESGGSAAICIRLI